MFQDIATLSLEGSPVQIHCILYSVFFARSPCRLHITETRLKQRPPPLTSQTRLCAR